MPVVKAPGRPQTCRLSCYVMVLLTTYLLLTDTWVKIDRLMLSIVSLVIVIDIQHEFIRDARSHERKIRIELKDFIDRMKKKKGQL